VEFSSVVWIFLTERHSMVIFFGNILWSNVLNISCNFVRDLFVVGNGTVCSRGKK